MQRGIYIVSQKVLNVYFHGSSRQVEVKGRYDVGMEDSQSTNQISPCMNLGTTTGKVGGVYTGRERGTRRNVKHYSVAHTQCQPVHPQCIYKCKNEVGCRDDTVPKTVDTRRHCEEE